jgi:hypothetical protein
VFTKRVVRVAQFRKGTGKLETVSTAFEDVHSLCEQLRPPARLATRC